MKTWLVLDVSFLCYRAFHTTKHLSHQGKATGVTFGFLKSITALKDEFQTDRVAFCFDSSDSLRRDIFPAYKRKRHSRPLTPEQEEELISMGIQIKALRTCHLRKIGFMNVFCFPGYESDDIMAKIAETLPEDEEAILVTADSDLLQCLRPNVTIYSPAKQKMLTEGWFFKEYGFAPRKWAVVKAVGGCRTDEVPGVRGVAELTAIRFLRGQLKETSKAYLSILSPEGKAVVRRNRRLVQLPFEGCPTPLLQEDQITEKGWKEVCSALGMKSIASAPPIATRKR